MARRAAAGLLAVPLILTLLTFGRADAQSITPIAYEQTVAGEITRDAFRQVYTFVGRAGDVINLAVTVTGGTLDPILVLLDSDNHLIARDDDSGKGLNAAILSFQLPGDGSYFVVVARFGQERGLTTGTYSLTLSRVGLDTSTAGTALHYGDSIVSEIRADAPEQTYAFQAQRGDVVQITMQRISGDLDPLLIVADATGAVVAINDEDPASPGTLDAAVRDWLVRKTGNYVIVATRFGRGAGPSKGGFLLTLDQTPPDTLGKTGGQAILVDYGQTLTGTIDNGTVQRFYQFEARKGDVLTLDAERTRGNLDPILTLYTADLRAITGHDSGQRGQSARISAYTVPKDGTYIVAVSRYNKEQGFTAGDYSLSIIGRQGVVVGPQGILILQYGGAVTSTIDRVNGSQEYVFEGRAGDVISIVMQATSGDLLPQIVLNDAARRVLARDDPGETTAQITGFKLPASGSYVIIATRQGRAGGQSQGNYLLTLARDGS